jgi:hypothetical protein
MPSISAADPSRLPLATAASYLPQEPGKGERDTVTPPNRYTLPTAQWSQVNVKHPSYFTVVGTQAGTIFVSPGKRGDSTSTTTLQRTTLGMPVGGILPYPGEWWCFNNGAAAQEIVVQDGGAAEALVALGITVSGSGGAADVRNADADGDFSSTLNGLVTNNRLSVFNYTAGDWAREAGGAVSQINGQAHNGNEVVGGNAMAFLFGRDTLPATPVMRAVEARDASTEANLAKALIGLAINSRNAHLDLAADEFRRSTGDTGSITGRGLSAILAPYSKSLLVGHNTAGGLTRTIEGTPDSAAGQQTQFGDGASPLNGIVVNSRERAADQGLDATGVAGAAVTLTLAAPGANLRQHFTAIHITKFATALLVAAAAPVVVTTTNFPNNPSFNFPADAALQGTMETVLIQPKYPIRVPTANAACTIVCPATTNVIWRVAAYLYLA